MYPPFYLLSILNYFFLHQPLEFRLSPKSKTRHQIPIITTFFILPHRSFNSKNSGVMDISVSYSVSNRSHDGNNVRSFEVNISGGANNISISTLGNGSGFPSIVVNGRDISRKHANQPQEGRGRRPEEILHGVRGPGRIERRGGGPRTTAFNNRVLLERRPIPVPAGDRNPAPTPPRQPLIRFPNPEARPATRPRVRPSTPRAPVPRPVHRQPGNQAPPQPVLARTREREAVTAQNTRENAGNNDNECPICVDDIRTPGPYASCKACRIEMHDNCIRRWRWQSGRRDCPVW